MATSTLRKNIILNLQLQQGGFTLRKAKWNWNSEDEKKLKDVLKDIASKKVVVTTKDPYYWISFYVFQSKIPVKCIKSKVLSYINK